MTAVGTGNGKKGWKARENYLVIMPRGTFHAVSFVSALSLVIFCFFFISSALSRYFAVIRFSLLHRGSDVFVSVVLLPFS